MTTVNVHTRCLWHGAKQTQIDNTLQDLFTALRKMEWAIAIKKVKQQIIQQHKSVSGPLNRMKCIADTEQPETCNQM